jgi:asparagine synthase (glutamine-hydrolysing)
MCGICGELNPTSGPNPERLRAMTEALGHRGPDDRGTLEGDTCALGHTRLSIIDLDSGRQPIPNEAGDVWVVFNGEIYNYRELRRELVARGHKFITESDTEVIVHLYEDLGCGCVERLRGMFALAVWDSRNQKLLLARDRFGQKPLFYTREDGSFLFASEVKALLVGLRSSPAPDDIAIHHYLSLRFIPSPRTMFAGIQSLTPGHALEVEGASEALRRYWSLKWEPKHKATRAEQRELLSAKLVDAVRSHLVSDVQVGAFLSGGIDSSLVTAIAARELDRPLPTFSVGSEWDDFSDLPFARKVAERYGTEHHEMTVRPDVVRALPAIVRQLDQPGDPITACVQCAAQLAGSHVKVVLGGDGADELFGGYDRLVGLRLASYAHRLPASARRVLTRVAERTPAGHGYKSLGQRARWFAAMMNAADADRYALSTSYFRFRSEEKKTLYGDALSERTSGYDSEELLADVYRGVPAKGIVDRMLATDVETRLPGHLLLQVDRLTMALGLEARSPLLDHELGELIAQFPGEAKVRGRRLKALLRDVARAYLPADIVERPKQGFMLPISHWLRGELGDQAGLFLTDSRLVRNGYVREAAVRSLIAEHRTEMFDHHHRIWMLLNLEVWWRLYVDGQEPGAVSEELGRDPRARAWAVQ